MQTLLRPVECYIIMFCVFSPLGKCFKKNIRSGYIIFHRSYVLVVWSNEQDQNDWCVSMYLKHFYGSRGHYDK